MNSTTSTENVDKLLIMRCKKFAPNANFLQINKGLDLMLKMGYQRGEGLGKQGNGIVEPIKVTIKNNRKGIGTSAEISSKRSRKRNRSNLNGLVRKSINNKNVLKLTRKQRKAFRDAERMFNYNNNKKIKKRQTRLNRNQINKPQSSEEMQQSEIELDQEQLIQIAKFFNKEIQNLFKCLELEYKFNIADKYSKNLFVVKIAINNFIDFNEDVQALETLRQKMTHWIGLYQIHDFETPKFHDIFLRDSLINVVCGNAYAYNCLVNCITDDANDEQIFRILQQPKKPKIFYFYLAIANGIMNDPIFLLKQIQLHNSELPTNRWIIVTHTVCRETQLTNLLLIIDEASTLTLNYKHNNHLFICLQAIDFFYRGKVSIDDLMQEGIDIET